MGKTGNPIKNKDILSIRDFDPRSVSYIFRHADVMRKHIGTSRIANTLTGRIIALLFFEPSTRTHNSFSASAQRLGAGIIGIQNTTVTSMFKGESFEDTIRMMDGYADAIVIRHREPGSAQRAADVAAVPVINGGDGGNEHPTQMLLDLYTVYEKFDRLDRITCVVGIDPKHSRAIRSFLHGLAMFKNNRAFVLSSRALCLAGELKRELEKKGLTVTEIDDENDIPRDAHVWYWNRVQIERFKSAKEYRSYLKKFVITPQLLKRRGNSNMIIMDPLPRIEEIDTAVDSDPRAYYYRQAVNGMYIRMALMQSILAR